MSVQAIPSLPASSASPQEFVSYCNTLGVELPPEELARLKEVHKNPRSYALIMTLFWLNGVANSQERITAGRAFQTWYRQNPSWCTPAAASGLSPPACPYARIKKGSAPRKTQEEESRARAVALAERLNSGPLPTQEEIRATYTNAFNSLPLQPPKATAPSSVEVPLPLYLRSPPSERTEGPQAASVSVQPAPPQPTNRADREPGLAMAPVTETLPTVTQRSLPFTAQPIASNASPRSVEPSPVVVATAALQEIPTPSASGPQPLADGSSVSMRAAQQAEADPAPGGQGSNWIKWAVIGIIVSLVITGSVLAICYAKSVRAVRNFFGRSP